MPRLGVLEERQFRLLWAGRTVSAFGDGLFPVALAFAVVGLTGSAADLGLVFTALLGARVALTLAGGVWSDRLPRQRVMLSADLLRCGTQAVVAGLLVSGQARLWHLLVLTALYGAGDAFFAPAATGLVPQTVPAKRVQQANAFLGLSSSGLGLAGPAVAGVVVATAGAGWAFAADAATFALSACFLARLCLPGPSRLRERRSFLVEARSGWREVRRRTWVCTAIACFSVQNLALGALFVLGPFVADRSLGGAQGWGVVVTAAGIGAFAGGAVALRWRPRRPLATGLLLTAVLALEPALLARPFGLPLVAAAAALGFGASAFSDALWFTALQERIPREAISRVSAYDWIGSVALKTAGYALVGPLVAALGTGSTLLGAAAMIAAAGIAASSLGAVRAVRAVS